MVTVEITITIIITIEANNIIIKSKIHCRIIVL